MSTQSAACPYYGGLVKDGKSTSIKCGNDKLLQQHPDKDPQTLFKDNKCTGLAGSDRYRCRAFLVQSVKDKKVNVGSDLCIPELQEVFDQIKDRPGCGDCEHYYWSAGYSNAAEPSTLTGYDGWKEWQSRKIPCENFTHYCRPEYNVLHEITADALWFCVRKPKNESEDNNMQENMTMTATMDITPEYQQAIDLHHRIIADAEAAASALISLAQNLKRMRDDKLFTQLGFESFEDYTEKAVGLKRRQAYNYISALEKLPSHLLQSNAHLGITKLELLAQVPALDREDFLEENDVDGMSVREMDELVKQVKDQGEQISMITQQKTELERENTELIDKNRELIEKDAGLDNVRNELAQARARTKELEARPVDVAVQEPDEETLEKIRKEAREAAEAEAADKIKKEEDAAQSDADAKIKEIQSKQDTRVKEAREQAAKDAAALLQKSLDAAETDKAEALKRAIELEKQLKIAGDPDAVLIQHHFNEIQHSFSQITGIIEKKQDNEPDFAKKYAGALSRALDVLKEQLAGQTSFDNGGGTEGE